MEDNIIRMVFFVIIFVLIHKLQFGVLFLSKTKVKEDDRGKVLVGFRNPAKYVCCIVAPVRSEIFHAFGKGILRQ